MLLTAVATLVWNRPATGCTRANAVLTFPSPLAVTSFSQRNARRDEEAPWPSEDEAEPTTRDARFIKTAVEILRETGRTDFTVQEVVARSKTSLRAFYQHFSSKDELLIALFDRTIAQSVQAWRAETDGLDSTSALKLLIDRLSPQPESSTQDSLNRAMKLYNQHLAETGPREYARVLSPAARPDSRHRRARHHRGCLQAPFGRRRRRPPSSCRRSWARSDCIGSVPN